MKKYIIFVLALLLSTSFASAWYVNSSNSTGTIKTSFSCSENVYAKLTSFPTSGNNNFTYKIYNVSNNAVLKTGTVKTTTNPYSFLIWNLSSTYTNGTQKIVVNYTTGTNHQSWISPNFVVPYCPKCGNNITEIGEQCDGGVCCNSSCKFNSSTNICRTSAGVCDAAETCTGSSATCPSDAFSSSTTVCGTNPDQCSVAANCTGTTASCPPSNPYKQNGATCNDSNPCSDPDVCTAGQCAGAQIQPTQSTCGVGACTAIGILSCVNGQTTDTCTVGTPQSEICNGVDDDCDGFVDEDLTRQTTCGTGICEDNTGSETCTNGNWGGNTCKDIAGSTDEVCNNQLDDDCDGTIDENCTPDVPEFGAIGAVLAVLVLIGLVFVAFKK